MSFSLLPQETDYDIWTGVDTTPVEDQRPVVLGEDEERYTYLYFPHMLTDLRIYRQAQIKEEKEKQKKKVKIVQIDRVFSKRD